MNSEENQKPNNTENAKLVQGLHRVTLEEAARLRMAALVVSWVSYGVLLTLGIWSLVIGEKTKSSSAFAFALSACLDTMTSVVVIWRYCGNTKTLYSNHRERLACFTLGILIIISSASITVKSVVSMVNHDMFVHLDMMFYVALASAVVCLSLMSAKVYLGFKLESRTLIVDAFNSLIGGIISISMMIDNKLHESRFWITDSVVGLICATALLIYGLYLIVDSSKGLKLEKKQGQQETEGMKNIN